MGRNGHLLYTKKEKMKILTTKEEALAEVNLACDVAWDKFVKETVLNDIPEHDLNLAKMLFRSGYISGAQFVSGYLMELTLKTTNCPNQ
jgi:hypothetical protein